MTVSRTPGGGVRVSRSPRPAGPTADEVRDRVGREHAEKLAALTAEVIDAAPAIAELAAWCDDAGVGDGGEFPSADFDRHPGGWSVSAWSFYDGHGDSGGRRGHGRPATLRGCVEKTLQEVREHPDEQYQEEKDRAAMAVSMWLSCGIERARELVDAIEATLAEEDERGTA